MILHTALRWQQNINQNLYSQDIYRISPWMVSYEVFTVRIWEEIDHIIMALYYAHSLAFAFFWCDLVKISFYP